MCRPASTRGLLVAPGAAPRITGSSFTGKSADVLWGAARPPPISAGYSIPEDRHRTAAECSLRRPATARFEPRVPPPGAAPTRVYRGEQFIGEDTTWEGEVLIDGTVMVAPVARLTIAPGTVVRFGFRDTDADGVGESELFIQGRLLAEGTREAPIVFTALDGEGRGRWGAINLMGTDAEESRLAWCLVESGFRGLHSHFSRFRAEHSIFRNNYRSIQFQESTAAITDCAVTGSASALRFRDSTAAIESLSVFGNTLGIQILRSSFSLVGSSIVGNSLAGMHVREMGGACGVLYSMWFNEVRYAMGATAGNKGWISAIVGGIGNIWGSGAGGMILGLLETFGGGYLPTITRGLLGSEYEESCLHSSDYCPDSPAPGPVRRTCQAEMRMTRVNRSTRFGCDR